MEKINEKGYTQTVAADILGVDLPKISQMKRQMESNEIHGFSLLRLLGFLENLGFNERRLEKFASDDEDHDKMSLD
ncbi:unnamed protein product [Cunninghamella blakesleeana]